MRQAVSLFLLALGLVTATAAGAVTHVVTSTDDSGPNTLRQAIIDSNATVDVFDIIEFDIDGPPFTIQPTSALPIISDPVFIDGFSQPGVSPNSEPLRGLNSVLLVEIDGTLAGNADGLSIAHTTASGVGTTVRGLVINRFASVLRAGIRMSTTGNHNIEGNFIGTDVSGLLARPNDAGVITGIGADGVGIGGVLPASRNLISGNTQQGVALDSDDNIVIGNLIGTDRTGVVGLGNGLGLQLLSNAANNRVGNFGLIFSTDTNTISGNLAGGVVIDVGSVDHSILGNKIGVGMDGLTQLGNGTGPGVNISGNGATLVNNQISGNISGIALNAVTDTTIQANIVGSGTPGNIGPGIIIVDSNDNLIGGTIPEGNEIAGNGGAGVLVIAILGTANGNRILANAISANGDLGIDLVNGANGGQSPPLLSSATGTNNNRVIGSFSGIPITGYHLEFFANQRCDPSGNGEGEEFIGSLDVVTDGGGLVFIDEILPAVPGRPYITATATDLEGNTSEFSNCVLNREQIVAPAPTLSEAGLAGALLVLLGIAALSFKRRAALQRTR
jgi:hypothetical protein